MKNSIVPRETLPLMRKIAEACKRTDTHRPSDIYAAIRRGELQAWTGGESLVVTCVNVFPRVKVFEILWAAGDLAEVVCIINQDAVPWAKQAGCARVVSNPVRKGWETVAKANGWEPVGVMLGKEI